MRVAIPLSQRVLKFKNKRLSDEDFFHERKKIGVLKYGKLAEIIPKIAEICDKRGEKNNIVYENDIKLLLKNLLR